MTETFGVVSPARGENPGRGLRSRAQNPADTAVQPCTQRQQYTLIVVKSGHKILGETLYI